MKPHARRMTLLVVEDQFIIRVGLRVIIDAEPDMVVVAEAETGPQGLALFRQHTPDVTLMDLRLPGMGGIETTLAIRKEFPQARIAVLTRSEGHEPIYQAFQAGVRAYLLKGVRGSELVQAIRDVHAGKRVIPPDVAGRLAHRMPMSDLSPREHEVLTLIVRGSSNKEIATTLRLSEATVRTHVSHMLSKLGVRDRTQAATAALESGLIQMS